MKIELFNDIKHKSNNTNSNIDSWNKKESTSIKCKNNTVSIESSTELEIANALAQCKVKIENIQLEILMCKKCNSLNIAAKIEKLTKELFDETSRKHEEVENKNKPLCNIIPTGFGLGKVYYDHNIALNKIQFLIDTKYADNICKKHKKMWNELRKCYYEQAFLKNLLNKQYI